MEKGKEKPDESLNKIKIFSSDDDKLKILGELLSNKSSRDIIKLLIDKEMYINEIAKKLELKVSLVIHHLQKMEAIGLLEITNKKIARKGEMHRFFKIPSGMLIFLKQSEEEVNNGILKKIFKEGIKFAVIGFAAISSWFSASIDDEIQQTDELPSDSKIPLDKLNDTVDKTTGVVESDLIFFVDPVILIPIIVISCSLFLIWFSKKYK